MNGNVNTTLDVTNFSATLNYAEEEKVAANKKQFLKQGIWLYFLLLIFEGALRKWLLPEFSKPLLIIRDPVAICLLAVAWKRGLLPLNPYIFFITLIGGIGIFTAVLIGHGNLQVALYGARILLLHFPLLFAIGNIFNRDDVVKMCKVILWLSIPMTILIALQFYSPQSSWVNRGIGGDIEGAGFAGSMDFFRPPATFSFTNGTALFYGLVACCILYFWVNMSEINRPSLIIASVCLLAAIPLSISRTLFFEVMLSVLFLFIALWHKPTYLKKIMMAVLVIWIAFSFLNKRDFFQTATNAFAERFESANEQEGGVEGVFRERFLGGTVGVFKNSSQTPFFGHGIGMGTNAGSALLTGDRAFLISEAEWGRLIGELGMLMGFCVILLRVMLTIKITLDSIKVLKEGDLLPWMLLSFSFLLIAQGGWAQPTALGFAILSGGLVKAALNK